MSDENETPEGEKPTDTTESGGTEPQPAQPPDQGKDDKPDVSGLQSALEKERALRKAAEKAAKEGDKHRARVEELEAANQSETEKAVAAARKEGAVEARKAADARLVRAEARALAAESRFRDPARVVRLLDGLDDVTVGEDGAVDTDAIQRQLTELSKEAPYLVASDDSPRPPAPNPAQGSSASGPSKTSGTDVGREMFRNRRGKSAASA